MGYRALVKVANTTLTAPSPAAPTSLGIGKPHDAFEQEADRVASGIMNDGRGSASWSLSQVGIGAAVQPKCACGGAGEHEERKEEQTVRRKAAGAAPRASVPPTVHEVLRSPGRPLDQATRGFMEPRFGHDFSRVRIHADAEAAQSAAQIHAKAYTVGNHVAFAGGRFAPSTPEGGKLLAHELAHVVQQDGAAVAVQRSPDEDDESDSGSKSHVPPDVAVTDQVQGDKLIHRERLDREHEHAFLVRITDWGTGTIQVSEHLYRGQELPSMRGNKLEIANWVDVTKQAQRDGPVSIEWNMPSLETDEDRLKRVQSPGLLYGLAPYHVMPYLRDQTLGIKHPLKRLVAGVAQERLRAGAAVNEAFLEYAITSAMADIPAVMMGLAKGGSAGARAAASKVAGSIAGETSAAGGETAEALGGTVRPEVRAVEAGGGGLPGGISASEHSSADLAVAPHQKPPAVESPVKPAATRATKATTQAEMEELAAQEKATVSAKGGKGSKGEAAVKGSSVKAKSPAKGGGPKGKPAGSSKGPARGTKGASGGAKRTRVEPYEAKVDKPVKNLQSVKEARRELAGQMRQRLPKGSKVDTVSIERTEAGRAQVREVTPEKAPVGMDVELKIELPDGTTFKPDGVKFLNRNEYVFQEHKEVMTVWENSHFSKPAARRELEVMLQERADIYTQLKDYGCKGFSFTTNDKNLADLIAEIISSMHGPGRQGLMAPGL
jgi:hypothetical protein